jgi:hypothetical protein
VPHDIPKRRVAGGRVTASPDRRAQPSSRYRRPATRGQRIWVWMSLFPAVFFLVLMLLLLASSVGLLAAVAIYVAVAAVTVALARLVRR